MMLNRLSKREKVLLYILVCLVIVAGGIYLLIIPSVTYANKVSEDFHTASELRKQVELDISLLDTRKASVTNESDKLEQTKSAFLDKQPTYDLDEKISKMINSRDLLSIIMEINEGAITEEETPTISEELEDPETQIGEIKEDTSIGKTDELDGTANIVSEEDVVTEVEVSPIHTVTMKLVVNGTHKNIMKLVDDFGKQDYIRVVSFDMGREDASIMLEIYML